MSFLFFFLRVGWCLHPERTRNGQPWNLYVPHIGFLLRRLGAGGAASHAAPAAADCLVHCGPACCACCHGPAAPWRPGPVPHRAACRLHCCRPRRCPTRPLPPPSPNRQEDSSVTFQCNDTVKITFDATDNQRVKVTLQYKHALTQKPVSNQQASQQLTRNQPFSVISSLQNKVLHGREGSGGKKTRPPVRTLGATWFPLA